MISRLESIFLTMHLGYLHQTKHVLYSSTHTILKRLNYICYLAKSRISKTIKYSLIIFLNIYSVLVTLLIYFSREMCSYEFKYTDRNKHTQTYYTATKTHSSKKQCFIKGSIWWAGVLHPQLDTNEILWNLLQYTLWSCPLISPYLGNWGFCLYFIEFHPFLLHIIPENLSTTFLICARWKKFFFSNVTFHWYFFFSLPYFHNVLQCLLS